MKILLWLLALGIGAGLAGWLWLALRRAAERRQAAEQREASFLAEQMTARAGPKPGAVPKPGVPAPAPQERMLLEAAAKAAEAGEPALSIQLYARLLSRFPETSLAAQARAAVDVQKKKMATTTAPGPAGRG
jgi:hypothetical protein